MRHRLVVALLCVAITSSAEAQIDPPAGISGGFGVSVRQSQIRLRTLQHIGMAGHFAGSRSIGERFALRFELAAQFFNTDDWAEFGDPDELCTTPDCTNEEGQEAMALAAASVLLWMRVPHTNRFYVLGGVGDYVVSPTQMGANARLGASGGIGYVLNPGANNEWSAEIRYHHLPSRKDNLRALIPLMLTISF
jgi:hypothetical protein